MHTPTVLILLATYQGERYLKDQLDSIAQQTYPHWQLLISDDGSQDGTCDIARNFSGMVRQKVNLIKGPISGSTRNFFHLMHSVDMVREAELYAFCDQDDVWLPEKLERAVKNYTSQALHSTQAYLYCTRTQVVDQNLKFLDFSPKPSKKLGFGNALLQNIASGNTMVFNHRLLTILLLVKPENSVVHDWTAYQAATGCGAVVYFDTTCSVLYRQHSNNLIGVNTSFSQKLVRLRSMVDGGYRKNANKTVAAIANFESLLTVQSRNQFLLFQKMRQHKNLLRRLKTARGTRLWHQTLTGCIATFLLLIFYRI
jgi:glycosyltransferase involved in cell wall biosynthesis